ncbi:MAG: protein translocase subunit SecD, partial [Candidatus Komeilibacteria bacterium]|nr:protein translocase subunit SecD [Candidatus Komeilibacteria bacterium]
MMSQRQQIWILFVLLIVLGFISGSIFFGKLPEWYPGQTWFGRFREHLGLDLQGGAHLIYQADTSKVTFDEAQSAIAGVRDVIEKRVNALGVSEPIVQTATVGDKLRVIVELAGVFDVNEAIKQIGATPLLEFKTEAVVPPAKELTAAEKKTREQYNATQFAKAVDTLKKIQAQNGQNFAELATTVSEDPGSAQQGGDLGFVGRGALVKEFGDALFDKLQENGITSELVTTEFGYHIIQRLESKIENGETIIHARHILLRTQSLSGDTPQFDPWQATTLGGRQLKKSEVQFDQSTGAPSVSLSFDDEGARLFEELTGANVGKRVAIFLDNNVLSAPVVQQKISGGKAVITGNFTIPEARELVERLNAGALPVPINLISQQTVGPSLGAVSISKSLVAGLIGFALIALFMVAFYRLSGLISVVALLFYASIVFSLFKLIPVTLTLAGIAGFILSLG